MAKNRTCLKTAILTAPLLLAASFLSIAAAAQQLAPVPQRAPHVPVNQQAVPDHRAALMQSRDIEGQAQIVDGDRLRIGEADLRLFGVVPPQLSASFGPQARALLDNLVTGQTTICHVRDRDRDGRLLATCLVGAADISLELLRHGLAVTARGSLTNTELAEPYLAAEQAAEIQHAGLWSVAITPPASQLVGDTAKTEAALPLLKNEVTKTESAKADMPVKESVKETAAEKDNHETVLQTIPVHVGAPRAEGRGLLYTTDLKSDHDDQVGFFQHYQILIAGGLMFVTTFGTVLALVLQRRYEKREEMKAIAAALRGELLAARAVCLTRLKTIHNDADDRAASWPRLRATLYQAYVGRLGWLGAQLSRQIASIYGQASDYAAYYNTIEDATQTPKRQALQTLANHIEEVLPRLEWVEVTGSRPAAHAASPASSATPFAAPSAAPPVEEATSDFAMMEEQASSDAAALSLPGPAPSARGLSVFYRPAHLWQAVRQFVHQHLPVYQPTAGEASDYDMMLESGLQPITFHETAGHESVGPDHAGQVAIPEVAKPANDTAAAATEDKTQTAKIQTA